MLLDEVPQQLAFAESLSLSSFGRAPMRRFVVLLLICLPVVSGCGTFLHNLQPHRLWRWNYTDAPGRSADGLYSVPDDLSTQFKPSAKSTTVSRNEK